MRRLRYTRQIGVKLRDEDMHRLESIADERDLSLSELVRGFIEEALAKVEKEAEHVRE
jgi:AraC-like DNA-binding protein